MSQPVDLNNPVVLPPPLVVAAGPSKAGEIAYEVFGLVPVIGTFIGCHHAYKAITSNDQVDGWEIAKIITQIFSLLIIPQVILGCAHAIKGLVDYSHARSLAKIPLPDPILPTGNEVDPQINLALDANGLPIPLDAVDANGLPLPMNYQPI